MVGRKVSKPTVMNVKSEAHFRQLVSGRSLLHMRMASPTAAAESDETRDPQSDVEIDIIVTLEEALAAMAVPGTYLGLHDPGLLLCGDVRSWAQGFRDESTNLKALEIIMMETNSALVRDEQLVRTYGELHHFIESGAGSTLAPSASSITFFRIHNSSMTREASSNHI